MGAAEILQPCGESTILALIPVKLLNQHPQLSISKPLEMGKKINTLLFVYAAIYARLSVTYS